MKKLFLIAFTLSTIAGHAHAKEQVETEKAVPITWSGAYFGLRIGSGTSSLEFEALDSEVNATSGTFEITVGGNSVNNNFLWGYELSLGTAPAEFEENNRNMELLAVGEARIRVGFAKDNAMLFATAGVGATSAKYVTNTQFRSGSTLYTKKTTNEKAIGYTLLGAGAGIKLSHSFSILAEYNHTFSGSETFKKSNNSLDKDSFDEESLNLSSDSFKIGLNYHF
ncbi:outer membrane protein [Polycladidibacter stylochi]|uniref:outer membrane protein n=1 Tax=Polycladidibacter stylochi TaxID=1807766 RepID=UPI00082C2E16|nr:outer membrane beta-barrel protein [Pseudovibrio stylochi]